MLCFPIMPQKIALLGGTFDPVHMGHLCMANWVHHGLKLDRVIFVPAAQPPHKQAQQVSSFEHRWQMLRLATANNPAFELSDLEQQRTGPSYTVDTLKAFGSIYPQDQLWWVIGLDSLYQLPTWHRYQDLLIYARLAVLPRPGKASDQWQQVQHYLQTHLPGFENHLDWLEMPRLDLASSEIRRYCKAGKNCRYLLPDPVWEYVQQTELYR